MDSRLIRRGAMLEERIYTKMDIRIHRISNDFAEEMSYYRYLSNDRVSEQSLMEGVTSSLKDLVKGKDLLAISDSSDMDYSNHHGRIKRNTGLGYIGNGGGLGYNIHPTLVLDANNYDIYGFSDIQLWHREDTNLVKEKRYNIALSDKESYRWLSCCEHSNKVLKSAQRVTYIQDREGDMYDTFVKMTENDRHLLIRSSSNRVIKVMDSSEEYKLHEYRKELPLMSELEVDVRDNCPYSKDLDKKRTARKAKVQVRYAQVSLQRSKTLKCGYQKHYPLEQEVYVLYVEECPQTVPEGEKPIFWCLLTTHVITDKEMAMKLIFFTLVD